MPRSQKLPADAMPNGRDGLSSTSYYGPSRHPFYKVYFLGAAALELECMVEPGYYTLVSLASPVATRYALRGSITSGQSDCASSTLLSEDKPRNFGSVRLAGGCRRL